MRRLCAYADLAELECRAIEISGPTAQETLRLFLIKKGAAIYAYRNSCPHTGAPLNWQPHEFLNSDKSRIQCSLHGAQFCIETGYCSYGPCYGDRLRKLKVKIENGDIYLDG